MRDDLVEQQNRREAGHLGNQTGVSEHEPDQQRLLFAGRGVGGGDALVRIDDLEIGQMRAVERAPRGRIAGAIVAQHRAVALLDFGGGMVGDELLHPAVERDLPRPGRPSPCGSPAPAASRCTVSTRRPATATASSAVSCSTASSQCASGRGSSKSRLRERSDRSSALTRLPCSASTASTSRSRKRRRSDGAPVNSASIAGMSQTTRT